MTIKVETYHAGYGDAPASLYLSGPSGELLNLITAICLAGGDSDLIIAGLPAEDEAEDEAEEADELFICLPDLSAGPVDESGESAGFATSPETVYVIRDAVDGSYVVFTSYGHDYTFSLTNALKFRSAKVAEAWVDEYGFSSLLTDERWNILTKAEARALDTKAALT